MLGSRTTASMLASGLNAKAGLPGSDRLGSRRYRSFHEPVSHTSQVAAQVASERPSGLKTPKALDSAGSSPTDRLEAKFQTVTPGPFPLPAATHRPSGLKAGPWMCHLGP